MKRLISIAIGAVGLCLSGCASETVENRQEIQLHAGTSLSRSSEEYRFATNNLPFAFRFDLREGNYEFGQHRMIMGSGLQKDVVTTNAVFRFELKGYADDPGSLFVLSNGVLRLVRQGDMEGHLRMSADSNKELPLEELKTEVDATGKWLGLCFYRSNTFTIDIKTPGMMGAIIGAKFKIPQGKEGQCTFIVHEMTGLRLFRYFRPPCPW